MKGTYYGSKHPPAVGGAIYTCQYCKQSINPNAKSVAQKVTGWVAPRSGGGTNHVLQMVKLPEFAHKACLDELQNIGQGKQEGLF
jgi:hypothetical protein